MLERLFGLLERFIMIPKMMKEHASRPRMSGKEAIEQRGDDGDGDDGVDGGGIGDGDGGCEGGEAGEDDVGDAWCEAFMPAE